MWFYKYFNMNEGSSERSDLPLLSYLVAYSLFQGSYDYEEPGMETDFAKISPDKINISFQLNVFHHFNSSGVRQQYISEAED